MRVDLCYVSGACNRTPNICDWGNNGLICYGSCNSIIIYNPEYPGTSKDLKILTGHTKRVNSVKWIRCEKKSPMCEKELVSASSDGTAIIWSLNKDNFKATVLKGHENGVNIVEAIYTNDDDLLVVTTSIDSTIKIWKRNTYGGEVTNIQTLHFGRGLCLALSLTFLPETNNILLACARDNSKIQIYSKFIDDEENDFELVETLKGHENWVRGLDFTIDDKNNVLLASCAQDTFIRIWCIKALSEEYKELSAKPTYIKPAMESRFSVTAFKNEPKEFRVYLETVLCGHEGWIYGVNWCPKILKPDGSSSQPMKLLSSSLDKTMVIWALDESNNWMDIVRVGEVGGNTLGFYGSKFSPDGLKIIGHGYLGSFHLWSYCSEKNTWEPGVVVGGHSNEVVDIAWEPKGEFLISASLDQTTRIHSPWVRNNGNTVSWHELARPQVHGYDMSCLALLSRYKFVSGAEEKIVRAFQAPRNFVTNFRRICNISDDKAGDDILNATNAGPRGASVPSLGLSNKAVYEVSNEAQVQTGKEMYPEDSYFHEVDLEAPPSEENLLQNTLWPEIQKLYGHGYEVFSLAASHDGKLVASACKATKPEHAAVIIWDADTWQQLQKLLSHTLTVTQISFSPDNNRLLTVSRDRRWSIFEKNPSNNDFKLVATTDKKNGIHARIIWSCAWSHDSKYFVTVSRDGKAVIWWKNEEKIENNSSLGLYEAILPPLELKNQSITAVSFAPVLIDGSYLLCLGLESGILMIYKWSPVKSWEKCLTLDQRSAHHLTVKRVSFRPRIGKTANCKSTENILQVASCSSDYSVKIHNIYLD